MIFPDFIILTHTFIDSIEASISAVINDSTTMFVMLRCNLSHTQTHQHPPTHHSYAPSHLLISLSPLFPFIHSCSIKCM